MLQFERKEIEEFIIDVFNYYNGKINVCNPASIKVNWVNLWGSTIAGDTKFPGVITINPMVILRTIPNDCDIKLFKYFILVVIIHELYHVDQFIHTPTVYSDPTYIDRIENNAECMTMQYIASNRKDIMSRFDIIDINNIDFNNAINIYATETTYERKYYVDHIILTFQDIFRGNNLSKNTYVKIVEYLQSEKSEIYITINGNQLIIKKDDYYVELEDFNSFMYENFLNSDIRFVSYQVDNNINKSTININVKAELKNIMCINRKE